MRCPQRLGRIPSPCIVDCDSWSMARHGERGRGHQLTGGGVFETVECRVLYGGVSIRKSGDTSPFRNTRLPVGTFSRTIH